MNDTIVYKSADEICKYIKENPKDIARLVQEEGLPAWRRNDKGTWRALSEDLTAWLKGQRDKYIKTCQ